MAVGEVVHLPLQRGRLPRCRMPRRRCRTYRLRRGWLRRPRIWRPHIWLHRRAWPRRRTWRLLTSPPRARLRRHAWPLIWRPRMPRRHHGTWRCRMKVGRASPKAALRLIVPLLRLRTNEAGPSADGLPPAPKDMVGTQMRPRASSTAMPASATSTGAPPGRRTRPKIVTRCRAPGNSLAATLPSGGAHLPKRVMKRSAEFRRVAMKDAASKAVWSNAAHRSSEIRSSPINGWRAGVGVQRHRK